MMSNKDFVYEIRYEEGLYPYNEQLKVYVKGNVSLVRVVIKKTQRKTWG